MIGTTRRRMYGGKGKEAYLCSRDSKNIILIDNGITYKSSYSYEVKLIHFGNYGNNGAMWALLAAYEKCFRYTGNNQVSVDFGSQRDAVCNTTFAVDVPVIFKYDWKSASECHYYVNSEEVSLPNPGSYTRGNLINFFAHTSGGWAGWFNGGIAYFKQWEGDTLITDLVPEERDGVCGFYDKVGGGFYAPSGTNTLTIEYF